MVKKKKKGLFQVDASNSFINSPPHNAGVYLVKIVSVQAYESQAGNARIRFNGIVHEGTAAGCTINDGLNIPKSADDNVIPFWLRFMLSLGYTLNEAKEKMQAGDICEADFVDRVGYCHFTPSAGVGEWPKRRWLTPGQGRQLVDAATGGVQSGSAPDNGAGHKEEEEEEEDVLGEFLNI